MPIKGVHARKGFLAPFTRVRPDIQMERLVALAIVLSCKALVAPRPLALKRPLLVMRSNMPSKIEMTSERAAAPWDRALEVGLRRASVGARFPCSRRRNMHTLDGLAQVNPPIGGVVVPGKHTRARVWAVVWASTVRSASGSLVATATGADATLIDIGGHTGRNRHGRRSKRTIRCGVQSSVLIELRRSVVRHVVAPRATNVSAAGTGVAKGAYALSLLYSRSAEAAKHGVNRVLPERSADAEVELGDTTAEID